MDTAPKLPTADELMLVAARSYYERGHLIQLLILIASLAPPEEAAYLLDAARLQVMGYRKAKEND